MFNNTFPRKSSRIRIWHSRCFAGAVVYWNNIKSPACSSATIRKLFKGGHSILYHYFNNCSKLRNKRVFTLMEKDVDYKMYFARFYNHGMFSHTLYVKYTHVVVITFTNLIDDHSRLVGEFRGSWRPFTHYNTFFGN